MKKVWIRVGLTQEDYWKLVEQEGGPLVCDMKLYDPDTTRWDDWENHIEIQDVELDLEVIQVGPGK